MAKSAADLSIAEAGRALRSGALTSLDLTQAHLDRIAAVNPSIGAFVHVASEAAMQAARAADVAFSKGVDRGALQGIPFAIKDIFDVSGWPVRYGSRAHSGRVAGQTAPAVQRLLDVGAVPLGLVATYELATVGPDADSLYSQPRNPWNSAHISGGSSSGSAAAVAAGMVRVTLGTDTGGSVRSPAAYCGVVGLKPSFGAISLEGVMPLAPSMDHVGPLAKTVAEAALMFAALTGRAVDFGADIAGLRIGFARDWGRDDAAAEGLLELMDQAASALSLLGARVDLCDLPAYAEIEKAATKIILAEEFESHGAAVKRAPKSFGPMAAQSILSGENFTSDDVAKARETGRDFGAKVDELLSESDVLLTPVTLSPAPKFSDFEAGKAVWTAMRTMPFNVTGHPAISVPMGFVGGLPMGLQIIGRRSEEAVVLRVAAAFEGATDHGVMTP